jgi:hypothetical protein
MYLRVDHELKGVSAVLMLRGVVYGLSGLRGTALRTPSII